MAVQQNRKTPSKRDMRRSHDALGYAALATEQGSGQRHLRHHVTKDGFYRGKQVIQAAVAVEENEQEQA